MKKRISAICLAGLLAMILVMPAYAAPKWEPVIPGQGTIGISDDGSLEGLIALSIGEGFLWEISDSVTREFVTDGPYTIQNLSNDIDMNVTLVHFTPDPGNTAIDPGDFEFHFTGDLAITGDPNLNTGISTPHLYTQKLEAAGDEIADAEDKIWEFDFDGTYDPVLPYPKLVLDYEMQLLFEIAP